jgi:hypothetical protein
MTVSIVLSRDGLASEALRSMAVLHLFARLFGKEVGVGEVDVGIPCLLHIHVETTAGALSEALMLHTFTRAGHGEHV